MSKVSIIIPAYNVGKYIEHCVHSLLTQTYRDTEILIIDDGSRDNTPKICDNLATLDKRVISYHKSNGGVSSARNFGILRATGDYIMFVDGDDWLDCTCIEDMLECLKHSHADACFCSKYYKNNSIQIATTLNSSNALSTEIILTQHLRYGFIASPCFSLLKRSLISDVLFNESIHTLEDWEYNFRCLSKFMSVCILNQAYYHYRTVEGSASVSPLNMRKLTCFSIPTYINEYIVNNFPRLLDDAIHVPVFLIYQMLVCYSTQGSVDSAELIVRDFARHTLRQIMFNKAIKVKYKIYLLLASLHPILFKLLFNIKNKN